MNYNAVINQAVSFIAKWLGVSIVAYFGWTKIAPWIDSALPF